MHKRIYTELRDEIMKRRANSDATFLNSYSHLYARGQVMMIRRLADRGDDKPRSLWWVIERIRRNRALGSRSALLEPIRQKHPHDQFFVTDADRVFSERFGEGDLPSDEPLADLQARLLDELAKVMTSPTVRSLIEIRGARRVSRPMRRSTQRSTMWPPSSTR